MKKEKLNWQILKELADETRITKRVVHVSEKILKDNWQKLDEEVRKDFIAYIIKQEKFYLRNRNEHRNLKIVNYFKSKDIFFAELRIFYEDNNMPKGEYIFIYPYELMEFRAVDNF